MKIAQKKYKYILILALLSLCNINAVAQEKPIKQPKKKQSIKIKNQIIATQKALKILSENINLGYNSVQKLDDFEKTKLLIFKK